MDPSLIGTLIASSLAFQFVSRVGPPIYSSSRTWWEDKTTFYHLIPADGYDNQGLIWQVLTWLLFYNHQIKGNGLVVWKYKYNDNYSLMMRLPPFNKRYPIKTREGVIYVKIIGALNGKISAVELSVEINIIWNKRLFNPEHKNILLHRIKQFAKAAGINEFLGEMREVEDPEQKYVNEDSTWPKIPETYVNELLKTHAIQATDRSKFKVYPSSTTNMETEILAAAAVVSHSNTDRNSSETLENELDDPCVVEQMTLGTSNDLDLDVTGC